MRPPLRNWEKWFQWNDKIFYKKDEFPNEIWINREILVQLNLTGKCPLNCDFCYIRNDYGNMEIPLDKIKRFWKKLKKFSDEYSTVYRVNVTGGDVFSYSQIEELIDFLRNEDSVIAVDPLLNRFWNNNQKKILERIIYKISYVQFNVMLMTEGDVEWTIKHDKWCLLKYPIYKGNTKKMLNRILFFMKKYDNTLLGFDWIIPQNKEMVKWCYINDIKSGVEEARMVINFLKSNGIEEERILPLFCIIEREIYNRTYLCAVGVQGIYIMPDGNIVMCSRYPWLKTGFTIDNFEPLQFFKKFNHLISNTCLFENKYFKEKFWRSIPSVKGDVCEKR